MTRLIDEARTLLDVAAGRLHGPGAATAVEAARARLDQPLRVAIAGRIKSGKSTMLNAVIGQAAAATDAAECTKVVTWYRDGTAYLAWAFDGDGKRRQIPYRRSGMAATVDLDAVDLDRLDRVEVEFPSPHLRAILLIDTPGMASVSEQVSARAMDLLLPEHRDQGADAVVYLLRHLHERDADFLEAFTDPAVSPVGALRSIAVLSRADEVGNGRGDSLALAREAARRASAHPVLRTRVADVVPVSGLLAFTAATLTEAEFALLRQLAEASQVELERLLVSVDRWVAPSPSVLVSTDDRRALLDRFGVYGLRLALWLIRSGACPTAGSLAVALEERSGIEPLRRLLLDRFATRADVLKAARAVDLVAGLLDGDPSPDDHLRRELERVTASSHELAELRCLAEVQLLDEDELQLDATLLEAALVAIGRDGSQSWRRLGVDPASAPGELAAVARQRVEELRGAALSPLIDHRSREILNVSIRSVEAVHFEAVSVERGSDS